MSALKEVTCMRGLQARGTDDEIVRAIQGHSEAADGRRPWREEILGPAIVVGAGVE